MGEGRENHKEVKRMARRRRALASSKKLGGLKKNIKVQSKHIKELASLQEKSAQLTKRIGRNAAGWGYGI
jgi:hypothetical protein